MKKVLSLCIALGALAGCQSGPSGSDYEVVTTALQGSKALRQEAVRECARQQPGMTAEELKQLAIFLDTSPSRAQSLLCSRVIQGMSDGTLTYADLKIAEQGKLTPKIVRVLQGTN